MSKTRKLTVAFAVLAAGLAGALIPRAATAQPAPSGDQFQGILTAVWADPHPASTAQSKIYFSLAYPDGSRAAVDVAPALESQAVQLAGKTVIVRGAAVAAQSGESDAGRIAASAIEAAGVERQAAAAVTGTKKVLFILLKFKGDAQTPHKPTFFKKLTNPLTASAGIPGTINGFYDRVSYGKLQWSGAVAGNKWYTLPKTRTQYANCGSGGSCFAPQLSVLGDDALQLVKADVDVNAFDNINFVFNNDLDCCAWGGGYSNGSRSWGATWEPPWGQEAGTYVHELGHSLGLPHSGWRYYAYDSGHDQMSRGSNAKTVTCGTYNSVNFGGPNTSIFCSEPGGGFIMAHQDKLGWVPEARKAVHSTKTTKAYDIEANALPLSTKLKVVVVCLQGSPCSSAQSNGRFLTVEVKTRAAASDTAVPSEGLVIHEVKMDRAPVSGSCYFNSQSGWAMPYDAVTGDWDPSTCSGAGLSNLAYGVGQTFNDGRLGVKVEVLKKTDNVYRVRVTKSK